MDQVCDIRMPQLVSGHGKIQGINDVLPIYTPLSRFRLELFLYCLPIHILIDRSFLRATNLDIVPYPSKLRIRKRLPIFVSNHIIRNGFFFFYSQAIRQIVRNRYISLGSRCLQFRSNDRPVLF